VLLENIRCLKRESALAQVRHLMHETPEIGLDSVVHILQNLSPAQRAEVTKALSRLDSGSVHSDQTQSATSSTEIASNNMQQVADEE
jgi:hypothetical protein